MGGFFEQWCEARDRKNSLLCVGIDPAESDQRAKSCLQEGQDKKQWILDIVEQTTAFASAVKINRNYIKDLSREDVQEINSAIHHHGAVSIDDSKIADIGSTNHAALFHAKKEGFDSVTYAPFPGNIKETADYSRELDIGLIMLVLMSNPEYKLLKDAQIDGMRGYEYFAQSIAEHAIDGLVCGAPSPGNHISNDELSVLDEKAGPKNLILVPGIGAQGGDFTPILRQFGKRSLLNATRSICYASNPGEAARELRDQIRTAMDKV